MINATNRPLKVFLCHARSDSEAVRSIYQRLTRDGLDAWVDKEKLIPGQDWQLEIRKAVRESDVVIVCLSNNFNTAGFQQKEVRLALDTANEKLEGDIFIIPVRLDECDVPDSLARWQWVDLFEKDGYRKLKLALDVRAAQVRIIPPQKKSGATPIKFDKPKKDAKPASSKEIESKPPANTEAGRDMVGRDQTVQANEGGLAVQGDVSGSTIIHAQNVYFGDQGNGKQTAPDADSPKPRPPAGTPPATIIQPKSKPAETKKPKRNRNTQIILAIVGMIGVLCLVILGSLPWKEWFAPTPTITTTSPPKDTPDPNKFTDAKGVIMRLVPAGIFIMGSVNGEADEQPVHDVYLDAYYIDRDEVVVLSYLSCVNAGECVPPEKNTDAYDDIPNWLYPMVNVNWDMAKAYCKWRGADLPTEAQWEKAARGIDGHTYPWGESIDTSFANYDNMLGRAVKLGSFVDGASPYGLYDMAGNVWEWVQDWYLDTYYQDSPTENPVGPESGTYRVLRGGAWDDDASDIRSANRNGATPESTAFNVGFRCARPAE